MRLQGCGDDDDTLYFIVYTQYCTIRRLHLRPLQVGRITSSMIELIAGCNSPIVKLN